MEVIIQPTPQDCAAIGGRMIRALLERKANAVLGLATGSTPIPLYEELVRLRSHVEQFRDTLASAGPGAPVGRRLDFLLQELGRETNTVGSKASDAPLAQDVVELKTELERIREQVQNVE